MNSDARRKEKLKGRSTVVEVKQDSAESNFIRALGSNDYLTREKGLEMLTLFLSHKKNLELKDLLKLWKGLFFCFWHSDKVPIQDELAERLARLQLSMPPSTALLYYQAFYATMRREWSSIDALRMDKFLRFVRKFVRATFELLQSKKWDKELLSKYQRHLASEVLLKRDDMHPCLGLYYHLCDVYMTELLAVLTSKKESLPGAMAELVLGPFVEVLRSGVEQAYVTRILEGIFDPLIDECLKPSEGKPFKGFSLQSLHTALFDLAAAESTTQRARETLYNICTRLEVTLRKHKAFKLGEDAERRAEPSAPEILKREKEDKKSKKRAREEEEEAAKKNKKKGKKVVEEEEEEEEEDLDDEEFEMGGEGDEDMDLWMADSDLEDDADLMFGDQSDSDFDEDEEEEPEPLPKSKKAKKEEKPAPQQTPVSEGKKKKGKDAPTPAPAPTPASEGKKGKKEAPAPAPAPTPASEGKKSKKEKDAPTPAPAPASEGKKRKEREAEPEARGPGKTSTAAPASASKALPKAGKGAPGLSTPLGAKSTVEEAGYDSDPAGVKKRVRFELKKNLVHHPKRPPPPAEIRPSRTPPSAQPRGSALKKTSTLGAQSPSFFSPVSQGLRSKLKGAAAHTPSPLGLTAKGKSPAKTPAAAETPDLFGATNKKARKQQGDSTPTLLPSAGSGGAQKTPKSDKKGATPSANGNVNSSGKKSGGRPKAADFFDGSIPDNAGY